MKIENPEKKKIKQSLEICTQIALVETLTCHFFIFAEITFKNIFFGFFNRYREKMKRYGERDSDVNLFS